MTFYKRVGNLIPIVMVTLLLIGCSNNTRTVTKEVIVDRGSVVCDVLNKPVDRHMRAVIANGEKIISLGADEVVVTASELSDVYKKSCK